jgi:hypothetical protein
MNIVESAVTALIIMIFVTFLLMWVRVLQAGLRLRKKRLEDAVAARKSEAQRRLAETNFRIQDSWLIASPVEVPEFPKEEHSDYRQTKETTST